MKKTLLKQIDNLFSQFAEYDEDSGSIYFNDEQIHIDEKGHAAFIDPYEEFMKELLALFQKTMEDKVIGEEEKVSKEHAMSEIIRNELRRKQFRALQSIISGEKI